MVWVRATGNRASEGTFAAAAAFGEIVFNCTLGEASLAVLRAAGAGNLRGKVLVDVQRGPGGPGRALIGRLASVATSL